MRHRHSVAYWLRILAVNTVGALAAFGLLGGFVTNASWSVRWRALAASFVYANCIGGTLALLMPPILHRVGPRSRMARWITRVVAVPVLIVVGCALANVVGIAIGAIRSDEFVTSMTSSLWISFVVGTFGSLVVVTYETIRGRLDEATVALRTKELEEADARRAAAEAQLASLESRVNPHFLFNTLNSIAALTHDDPSAAERMTSQLASLMRSALDGESAPLVTLDEELRIVRDYLEIERVRFGDRLRFAIDVDAGVKDVQVPRLSLQTIVENSIKYAVSPRREGGSIAVRAKAEGAGVRIDIEDDGPGFDVARIPEGHGLALIRARLAILFGDRASLQLQSVPGRTTVTVRVPTAGSSA